MIVWGTLPRRPIPVDAFLPCLEICALPFPLASPHRWRHLRSMFGSLMCFSNSGCGTAAYSGAGSGGVAPQLRPAAGARVRRITRYSLRRLANWTRRGSCVGSLDRRRIARRGRCGAASLGRPACARRNRAAALRGLAPRGGYEQHGGPVLRVPTRWPKGPSRPATRAPYRVSPAPNRLVVSLFLWQTASHSAGKGFSSLAHPTRLSALGRKLGRNYRNRRRKGCIDSKFVTRIRE
jgi:hypothetical protein